MSTPATHGTEGAGTLVAVWAALVALTATLVAVIRYAPGNPGIVATMVITPTKAALVFWFFMHLREEGRAIRYFLFAGLLTVIVFVGLMMLDYGLR
jgi:cytochrome c oxidase subunit 4